MINLIQKRILFVLFVFTTAILKAQQLDEFSIAFTKTDSLKGKTEVSTGTIYKNSNKTRVFVSDPINQVMLLDGNRIDIFYPDRDILLRIQTQSASYMAFVNLFVSVVNENYNPAGMNYKLQNQIFRNDSLIIYWSPTENKSTSQENIIVKYFKNNLVSVEKFNDEGILSNKILYSNYKKVFNLYIPFKITLQNKQEPFKEEILFANMEKDNEKLAQYKQFKLPKDVQIQEIEW